MKNSFLPIVFAAVSLSLVHGQTPPGSGATDTVTVPAGTVLEIRLRQNLSSYGSKRDTPVAATVIAPVVQDGRTVMPMETVLYGRIRDVRGVGLGFARESAMMHIEFSHIQRPEQDVRELTGKIVQVDNAREQVDDQGRILGIRATNTFGTIISAVAIGASSFDPFALAFASSSVFGVFRIPDATIILPAGTEMRFEIGADLTVNQAFPPPYVDLFDSQQARDAISEIVRPMPFRTDTPEGEPSDLTSLLYIGSAYAVEQAFLAAGWTRTDELDAQSSFGVLRSIVENQGYQSAPMSLLVLDGEAPVLTFAKTLNTFFSRHHVRIYRQSATYGGSPVWTSTATYDSGIGFSKAARTFIHLIDENIDNERSKVLNDLVLTGCVAAAGHLDRPWVPQDASNATGDQLLTDGRIAIVELNDCQSPNRAEEPVDWAADVRERIAVFERPFRNAILRLRHDFTRGNIVYQSVAGVRTAWRAIKGSGSDGDAPPVLRLGGQEFEIVRGARTTADEEIPDEPGRRLYQTEQDREPPSYATQLMFSISSGLSGYGNERFATQPTQFIVFAADGTELGRDRLDVTNFLERGWTLSPKTTLNTWRYVSNEFSWSRTITTFRATGRDELLGVSIDLPAKARISRFTYNALIHLRPNGKRIRPYLAVGPAFQLIHLTEAKPAPANSLLKFAARDLAVFMKSYEFGRKPPLEGGGMFQVGLNYGGGIHFHLTQRLFLRADFRETLSKQPDFWTKSQEHLRDEVNTDQLTLEVAPVVKHEPLRHQLVTMGIGIAF